MFNKVNFFIFDQRIRPALKLLLIVIFLSSTLHVSFAQKFLQLEKDFVKTKLKYGSGDEIIFKLRQSDQWIRTAIDEIDVDNNVVHMFGLTVPIDSIEYIKSYKPFISPIIGEVLWKAGLATFATSALYGIFFQPPNTLDFLIATSAIALSGLGLKQMAKIRKVYSIGNKYNLRAIDVTIYLQDESARP